MVIVFLKKKMGDEKFTVLVTYADELEKYANWEFFFSHGGQITENG